jgi:hypothetical protein
VPEASDRGAGELEGPVGRAVVPDDDLDLARIEAGGDVRRLFGTGYALILVFRVNVV